jgi:hypothetical protein
MCATKPSPCNGSLSEVERSIGFESRIGLSNLKSMNARFEDMTASFSADSSWAPALILALAEKHDPTGETGAELRSKSLLLKEC